jgi:hypothetical protein
VTDLAPVLQGFFTDRLARQKKASPNTVAAYRDTCRLLLAFARDQTGKPPSALSLADLDATLVGAFLSHLEDQRGNGSATRNARLAAIHSLFKYAAPKAPEHAATISQVLAIPPRRRERAIVSYLTAGEIGALVAAPAAGPGTAAATGPCSCSASRPACGSPSSPASSARTSTSGPGRTSAATARAARTGPPPSPPRPPRSCGPGSPISALTPPARCSPPSAAGACPATPSSASSPGTPPPPRPPARRSATSTSPRTRCAIRPL